MGDRIEKLLTDVKSGKKSVGEALGVLRALPFEELGFAKIDHHRVMRKGFPEVIYCEGKSVDQITEIAGRILERDGELMATRAGPEVFDGLLGLDKDALYHEQARIVTIQKKKRKQTGKVFYPFRGDI